MGRVLRFLLAGLIVVFVLVGALLGYFLSKVANRSATQAIYRKMLIDAFGRDMVMSTTIPVMATLESVPVRGDRTD